MKSAQSPSYLKSAITQIYGDDDDFVLIGLTGRTGSGCSTAASILQSEKKQIKHTLFSGNNPTTSEARKERIIQRFFEVDWQPFLLIQVRSVITAFLLEKSSADAVEYLSDIVPESQKLQIKNILDGIRTASENQTSAAQFYSNDLPREAEALKNILGENEFVRVYQKIGKNIRLSGSAFSSDLIPGKFFSLAERINDAIKKSTKSKRTKSNARLSL